MKQMGSDKGMHFLKSVSEKQEVRHGRKTVGKKTAQVAGYGSVL